MTDNDKPPVSETPPASTEAAVDAERVADSPPPSPPPEDPPSPQTPPPTPPSKGRSGGPWLAVLLLMAGAAGGGFWLWQEAQERDQLIRDLQVQLEGVRDQFGGLPDQVQ